MMKVFSYTKLTAMVLLLMLVITACKKSEFMPDPVGEPIQAPDYPSLSTLLGSEYSLFKAAWEKAEMDKVLGVEETQNKLTFFVPSDKAMGEAGLSSAKIAAATKNDLQDLLRYHIAASNIGLEQLKAAQTDLIIPSLLKHSKFKEGIRREGAVLGTVPYAYRHSLTVKEGQLLDNGIAVKVSKEASVAKGTALFIDRVLKKPEKQMIDILREDGRFSLYLKAMEISNEAYEQDMILNMYPMYKPPLNFLVDAGFHYEGTMYEDVYYPRHLIRFTLFAPTNEAFRQMGIQNEADLRALQNRIPPQDMFNGNELTPIDSLLRYQYTAETFSNVIYNDDYTMVGLSVQRQKDMNEVTFYGHMLDDRILANYPIMYATINGGSWVSGYVPYRFNRLANHQLTVKHIKANPQPATVVEENINTLQGPIHVVDRILVPNDFSMWHKK
ncbi:fasciclin domain-containing protein [Pedobacter nutrimenti]|uniref:Fasciclin domain-containing protein n=1 Tax=Pedobacter nutrimenti TaxID=1241337 RepID=A0A318UR39_9SPHI|nr:fasciclin domain-containing protein [Pedobacter nutrimenti]PYF74029.1 fasciclin domain-containing protein [Pedobacter nutrimenti]